MSVLADFTHIKTTVMILTILCFPVKRLMVILSNLHFTQIYLSITIKYTKILKDFIYFFILKTTVTIRGQNIDKSIIRKLFKFQRVIKCSYNNNIIIIIKHFKEGN